MINLNHVDCMDFMQNTPDRFYDLAIVDPPYGIGAMNMDLGAGVGTKKRTWTKKEWDNAAPNQVYFNNLFRVSKNQIIWGGNYFLDYLNKTNCVLIWDKMQEFSGAEFELAWTSFYSPSKSFRMCRAQAYTKQNKIHPTQKPVALYKWLLTNYAKQGDKILDTHGGSMSIAIACHDLKFDLDLCELDAEYYELGCKRYQNHINQLQLF